MFVLCELELAKHREESIDMINSIDITTLSEVNTAEIMDDL